MWQTHGSSERVFSGAGAVQTAPCALLSLFFFLVSFPLTRLTMSRNFFFLFFFISIPPRLSSCCRSWRERGERGMLVLGSLDLGPVVEFAFCNTSYVTTLLSRYQTLFISLRSEDNGRGDDLTSGSWPVTPSPTGSPRWTGQWEYTNTLLLLFHYSGNMKNKNPLITSHVPILLPHEMTRQLVCVVLWVDG